MSAQVSIQKIKAGVSGKLKSRRMARIRGVRYERADGEVIRISRASALKLVSAGKAVEDTSRSQVMRSLRMGQPVTAGDWKKFSIVEKFQQSPLGNVKHHARETFDHFSTTVLIHPVTRLKVCPANPPKEQDLRDAARLMWDLGLVPAKAKERRGAMMAEVRPGGRQRIVVPLRETQVNRDGQ